MNPAGNPAVKHNMSAKEWIAVFLVALALHSVLFFLFVPMPDSFAESASGSRFTLYLEEQKLDLRKDDPYGLQYWLLYSDPELILKPDPETGFSMFQGRNELTIPDPAGIPFRLYETSAVYREPVLRLSPGRSISDFSSGMPIPVIPPLPDRRIFPAAHYPLWTDEAGRITQGLFLNDDQSFRILKQQHAAVPAVLRLTLQNGRIPKVLLLRSCGNQVLDDLAVRQLISRKANFQPLPSSEPCVKYFTVFWQAPDLKSIRKEDRP